MSAAAGAIAQNLEADSIVLTIQNGLGAGERISEHLPARHVLLGVAEGFGASMKGPGHVHHNGMNLIRIGELKGGESERVNRVAEVWQDAGFNVKAFSNIDQLAWEKFVCNVAFSGPCTVFGRTIGEIMMDPATWRIALGCAREAYSVGLAKGIPFSFDDADAYVTAFGKRMPHARPSMLLDHMAKRPSEIAAINGMVPVLGKDLGVPTPYNETLTAIIEDQERRFE